MLESSSGPQTLYWLRHLCNPKSRNIYPYWLSFFQKHFNTNKAGFLKQWRQAAGPSSGWPLLCSNRAAHSLPPEHCLGWTHTQVPPSHNTRLALFSELWTLERLHGVWASHTVFPVSMVWLHGFATHSGSRSRSFTFYSADCDKGGKNSLRGKGNGRRERRKNKNEEESQ